MFYDPSDLPFSASLRNAWKPIYDEYRGIRNATVPWPETELYGEGWNVFGLFDFPAGDPIEANIARCPFTASIVAQNFKDHGAAGFSVLQPQTRIAPHQGYQGEYLRCHLGLSIPPGDCALQVGSERRAWQRGELLVFDDRKTHQAWNLTDSERVVLLIDFVPSSA